MAQKAWVSPLQFLIIVFTMGIGSTATLAFSRSLAKIAKQDMWLSVILAGVLFTIAFLAAVKLAAYFPQQSSMQYHKAILGNMLGTALNAIMLLIMLAFTVYYVSIFMITVKIFLLDITPSTLIVLTLLLVMSYIIHYGLAPLIRLQQLLLLFVYPLFIILLLLGFLAIEVEYYIPILADGIKPVFSATALCWLPYSGPEFLTGLISPNIYLNKRLIWYGVAGIAAAGLLYLLIAIITLGVLGPYETAGLPFPTLTAFRSVEVPDTFIERLDGYLMLVWMPLSISGLAIWLFFTGLGIKQMTMLKHRILINVFLLLAIFILVALTPDVQTIINIGQWLNYIGLLWGLAIQPALLWLTWFKQRRRQS